MKKFKGFSIVIFIVFGISLFFSMKFLSKEEQKKTSLEHDVVDKLKINKEDLNIVYLKGNMLDESIDFGNKITKIIKIDNKGSSLLSYALSITESSIEKKAFTYTISIGEEENGTFTTYVKDASIEEDKALAYDLGIEAGKTQYLKVEFLCMKEGEPSTFKGILKIISNLSEKDVFIEGIAPIQDALIKKIDALNGINEQGYFTLALNDLKIEESNSYKGFILIDAIDYSSPKYYYTIGNNKYMLRHIEYKNIGKKHLQDVDKSYINGLNVQNVCKEHTKKDCRDFSSIQYRKDGGKDNFVNSATIVINTLKESFNKKEKRVYIYDVKQDIDNKTNVRGYILINNQIQEKPEYYLYITNDIYMISGYNMTKLGLFTSTSSTVRAYNETAFKLASESMQTICAFSGFNECFNSAEMKV